MPPKKGAAAKAKGIAVLKKSSKAVPQNVALSSTSIVSTYLRHFLTFSSILNVNHRNLGVFHGIRRCSCNCKCGIDRKRTFFNINEFFVFLFRFLARFSPIRFAGV